MNGDKLQTRVKQNHFDFFAEIILIRLKIDNWNC